MSPAYLEKLEILPAIMSVEQQIKQTLREVADFPRKVLSCDLTPLLLHPELTEDILNAMILPFRKNALMQSAPLKAVVSSMACCWPTSLMCLFCRSERKESFPAKHWSTPYDLEYGSATVK